MMPRQPTSLVCGFMLLLGIVIGATFDSWPLTGTVEANALDASTADRLYGELGNGDSVLVESGRHLAKIAALTSPSVVHIQSERKNARRGVVEETGSGVLMSSRSAPGTYVVTNRHVINGAALDAVSIHLHDGRVVNPVRVLTDKATDVAVLQVAVDDVQPARWGDSDKLEIGHMVLAMGSPFGLSQSITLGIISAKGRRSLQLGSSAEVLNQDFLQTDAAINPGNSGGPLIDMSGRVIGINTAIASNSGGNEGIGFSIPSNLVRRVVDQLLEHGRVQRAYLGVKLDSNFDLKAANRLKIGRLRGARVVEVYPGTPASTADLRFDDVLVSFDGIQILDENHLINLVSLTPVNRRVKLEVIRNGQKLAVDVVLRDRAELEQRSEAPMQPGMGVEVEQMGLTLHRVDRTLADQLGFNETAQGLLVLRIDADCPLAADIQLYDLIEEVARTPVSSIEDLERILEQRADERSMLIRVRRAENGIPQSRVLIWRR